MTKNYLRVFFPQYSFRSPFGVFFLVIIHLGLCEQFVYNFTTCHAAKLYCYDVVLSHIRRNRGKILQLSTYNPFHYHFPFFRRGHNKCLVIFNEPYNCLCNGAYASKRAFKRYTVYPFLVNFYPWDLYTQNQVFFMQWFIKFSIEIWMCLLLEYYQ